MTEPDLCDDGPDDLDRYLAEQLKDPEFAAAYAHAESRARQAALDWARRAKTPPPALTAPSGLAYSETSVEFAYERLRDDVAALREWLAAEFGPVSEGNDRG